MSTTLPLRETTIDVIHGIAVADPYRWLEDLDLAETRCWIGEQAARYSAYFASFAGLPWIQKEVSRHLDFDWKDQPVRINNRLFYRKQSKGHEQPCICTIDPHTGVERVLVDPAALGASANVRINTLSWDGSLLAFEVRFSGADACVLRIADTRTGRILNDHLPMGYARSFAFSKANNGFYYCREADRSAAWGEVCFHGIGDSETRDETLFRVARSSGDRLSILANEVYIGAVHTRATSLGPRIDVYIARQERSRRWNALTLDMAYPCVLHLHRERVFLRTEQGCPNGHIIEFVDALSTPKEVVPKRDGRLQSAIFVNDCVYIHYLRAGKPRLERWSLTGQYLESVSFPKAVPISLLHSPKSTSSLFYSHESWTIPTRVLEVVAENGGQTPFDEPSVPGLGEASRIEQVTYTSNDGTRIPMQLVTHPEFTFDVPRPTVLLSYGGFGVSTAPKYAALFAILLNLGVVIATPHIRGGSEFGRRWHEAALKTRRQTAFEDFIAAAEWLIAGSIAESRRLAIYGGSNSGLLVGAAMVQRPDLFKAVVCIGPLLDMVRYERFDRASKWAKEYGSISNPDEFDALLRYSPYHNVLSGTNYPSTLFVTGDSDDRCNPAHVRKMAALLQNREAQQNPILVDYLVKRGHHPGLPLSTRISGISRRLAFLIRELDITIPTGGRYDGPYA